MNYIQTLQRELREANERADAAQALIAEFRAHLASAKFHSNETERRDWIATADVLNRLSDIRDALYGLA